ncbi:MAG: hypothetical protein DME94_02595 [Verrucomicrobia bacterium]|nr:MAG: hypothetical protein DME94_02595 [Verrucomicrobiota bacterium]
MIVIISSRSAARSAEFFSNTISPLIRRIPEFRNHKSEKKGLLHVAATLVVGFLGQLAIELAVFHLTAALIQRLASYAASHLLSGAKCAGCEYRKSETNR